MTPYEALYRRHCQSSVSTGSDLVRDTSENVELIRKHLLRAQSRHKSYADKRRRPLEFEVGDHVFLKIMPKKGVVRFGKRGRLSSRYIETFKVLEWVGTVSYRLALPPSLSSVHVVFRLSMLWKYTPDLTHVVDWDELVVDANGTFKEGPVHIMNSRDQVLRGKTMMLVKVLWQHQGVEEATWERKDTIGTNYLFLFEDEDIFFSFDFKMTITYACDCMCLCV